MLPGLLTTGGKFRCVAAADQLPFWRDAFFHQPQGVGERLRKIGGGQGPRCGNIMGSGRRALKVLAKVLPGLPPRGGRGRTPQGASLFQRRPSFACHVEPHVHSHGLLQVMQQRVLRSPPSRKLESRSVSVPPKMSCRSARTDRGEGEHIPELEHLRAPSEQAAQELLTAGKHQSFGVRALQPPGKPAER